MANPEKESTKTLGPRVFVFFCKEHTNYMMLWFVGGDMFITCRLMANLVDSIFSSNMVHLVDCSEPVLWTEPSCFNGTKLLENSESDPIKQQGTVRPFWAAYCMTGTLLRRS